MDGFTILMQICMIIVILFTLAILIVYYVIPELTNFPGRLVRRYFSSYLISIMALRILFGLPMSEGDKALKYSIPQLCLLAVSGYFGAACLLWVNVLSYDLYLSFRNLPSGGPEDPTKRRKAQFIRYSIYAWGGSCLLFLSTLVIWCFLDRNDVQIRSAALCVGLFSVVCIAFCNTYLYILTVLAINKRTKKPAATDNESRSNLRAKLFIIMRVSLISWALPIAYKIAFDFHTEDTIYRWILAFCIVLEVVQRFGTFLIFVWKDDVKESFRKQCHIMKRRLVSFIRCDSTHACENGNGDFMTSL